MTSWLPMRVIEGVEQFQVDAAEETVAVCVLVFFAMIFDDTFYVKYW